MMRHLIFILLFGVICVQCKNHVKSLTESLGQEIIEIGAPMKELPPGLDEEPSAENDDDDRTTPSNVTPITKKETRKSTTVLTTTEQQKITVDTRRANALSTDEEERRIEKELSEIYKDTDYSMDSTKPETTKKAVTSKDNKNKPIARNKPRTNFKFQPDVNNRKAVDIFRTSIDEISCDKRVTQRLSDEGKSSASGRFPMSIIAIGLALLTILVCQ